MKKTLLVISHSGSGSTALCHVMDRNPRLQFNQADLVYDHPDVLDVLTNDPHKCNTAAATWVAEILYNQQFSCKALYRMCKFIYVVRDAKCLDTGPITAGQLRYYCYRLRRICEMARRTPGAVLATWDDLVTGRCFPTLEKYLNLKEPLERGLIVGGERRGLLKPEWEKQAQAAYERYLYFLRRGCDLQWDRGLRPVLG